MVSSPTAPPTASGRAHPEAGPESVSTGAGSRARLASKAPRKKQRQNTPKKGQVQTFSWPAVMYWTGSRSRLNRAASATANNAA